MLETKKSTTITGTSNITTEKGTQAVVYMSASISEDGSYPNITKTIQDKTTYLANKEECKADMDSFEDYVLTMVEA